MKKNLLLLLVLVLTCIVNAHDLEQYRETCREINLPNSGNWSYQPTRPVPNWTFSCTPVSLLFSYYDYMIGSYNDCPLYAEPDPQYGGYFMTFHAKRTPTGQRRVYQCYVDENGVLEPQSEQPIVNNWEGYPTLAVDPVSGKPLYAWHANVDADAEYEVQFAYDRFLSGFTGIMSTPSIVFDNPSIVMPYNTTNNEFIWPSLQIGPSPTAGMRRAYVLARNAETNTVNPSENVKIAYADFNGDMLEMGSFLTWSYISIPLLDIWNHDTVTWRRPYLAFTVGNDGNIYCIGYHDARVIATDLPVNEPDLDVFVCPNYGQGTWTRYTAYSKTPTWNPPTNFGTGPGYFKNANNVPYTNEQIYWKIINSNHFNAVYNISGDLHFTGLWAFHNVDNLYYSQMNVIKEVRFNVNTQQFTINEVYPKSGLSSDNILWQPWDINGDNLVDTFNTSTGDPVIITDWNYPHWNDAAHSNAMTFHYNNFKVTKPNANGWMACVWQNSWRAKQYNQYQNTAYSQYANVPEIFISVSSNYGQDWSEPM
ncbi:MAG: hypothetical protein FJ041_05000, partial [Candidatus Cloacimonetes bacterium]|nr:hypothetical protein [Candidatus Cloacimonadota bacterium]